MSEPGTPEPRASSAPLEERSEPLHGGTEFSPLRTGDTLSCDAGTCRVEGEPPNPDAALRAYAATLEGRPVQLLEATSEATAARLRREWEVLSPIQHAMFPEVLARFEREGRSYLVTEPATGTTLAEALAANLLAFPKAVSVLAQVASALRHLHQQGWAHLGIRPAAIGLSEPGPRAKLLDFSAATRLGHPPSGSAYHPGYSPPELLSGELVDERADVYGIAAVLLKAASGPAGEAAAGDAPPTPPAPQPGVPQILRRSLGKRETRYETMAELHRALLRLRGRCEAATSLTAGAVVPGVAGEHAACLTGHLESEEGPRAWALLCLGSRESVAGILRDAAGHLAASPTLSGEEQAALVWQWASGSDPAVSVALVIDRRLALAGPAPAALLRAGNADVVTAREEAPELADGDVVVLGRGPEALGARGSDSAAVLRSAREEGAPAAALQVMARQFDFDAAWGALQSATAAASPAAADAAAPEPLPAIFPSLWTPPEMERVPVAASAPRGGFSPPPRPAPASPPPPAPPAPRSAAKKDGRSATGASRWVALALAVAVLVGVGAWAALTGMQGGAREEPTPLPAGTGLPRPGRPGGRTSPGGLIPSAESPALSAARSRLAAAESDFRAWKSGPSGRGRGRLDAIDRELLTRVEREANAVMELTRTGRDGEPVFFAAEKLHGDIQAAQVGR